MKLVSLHRLKITVTYFPKFYVTKNPIKTIESEMYTTKHVFLSIRRCVENLSIGLDLCSGRQSGIENSYKEYSNIDL